MRVVGFGRCLGVPLFRFAPLPHPKIPSAATDKAHKMEAKRLKKMAGARYDKDSRSIKNAIYSGESTIKIVAYPSNNELINVRKSHIYIPNAGTLVKNHENENP